MSQQLLLKGTLLHQWRPFFNKSILGRLYSSSSSSSNNNENGEGSGSGNDEGRENIIERLQRFSMTSPEDWDGRTKEEVQAAKGRYKDLLREYNYRKEEFLRDRMRSKNRYGQGGGRSSWDRDGDSDGYDGGGGGGGGGWNNRNRRWFSTSAHPLLFQVREFGTFPSVSANHYYQNQQRSSARRSVDEGEGDRDDTRRRDRDFGQQRKHFNKNKGQGQYDRRQRYNDHDDDNDDSSGRRRRNSNSMSSNLDESRNHWNTQKGKTGNRGFEEGGGWVTRKERQTARNLKEWGRNLEGNKNENEARKIYRIPQKPTSNAVVGDYSSIANSRMSKDMSLKKQKESEIDLSSLLNQSDGDTFGTLSVGPVPVKDYVGSSLKKELMKEALELGVEGNEQQDEGDDSFFVPERPEKWNMEKLVKRIRILVDETKVKEAVDTLMSALDQGGFQYDRHRFLYIYNLLISSCAQVGYVKMAFRLFTDMKKRGFLPRESTYTSLFNSCSNATWDAAENIERMNRLRENMAEKGIAPNQIVYHAMIKGYGRNGDIESAFGVVDEMMREGVNPNTETFNMLLSACITDTQNGFKHLLLTWKKMAEMRLRPDIYSFNLLARGIRECGILPDSELKEEQTKLSSKTKSDNKFLLPITSEEESNQILSLVCLNDKEALETFNQKVGVEGDSLSYLEIIEALSHPRNRFAVFGGLRGFMTQMTSLKVGPNLKTVTELGQLTDPTDLGDLLMMMKTYKLQPDITFFNLMMKRYYDSGNPKGARKVLAVLPQFNLTPNIMTWGVGATGCTDKYTAQKFLEDMEQAKFTPNIQIMGGLLGAAIRQFDPSFAMWVMKEMQRLEIKPDPKVVLELEEFKMLVKKGIISKEMGKPIQPYKLSEVLEDMEAFEKPWKIFLFHHDRWLKSTEVKVEPKDPWESDFLRFKEHKSHGTLLDDSSSSSTEDNEQHIMNKKD